MAELDKALNMAGASKEIFGNLSDEDLSTTEDDLIDLKNSADSEAARSIAKRIASKIE